MRRPIRATERGLKDEIPDSARALRSKRVGPSAHERGEFSEQLVRFLSRFVLAGLSTCTGSDHASISGDGAHVAFMSCATNLVSNDNLAVNRADVFVRNRHTRTTAIVSVTSSAVPGNSPSIDPAISANGALVAFVSSATDLVVPDGNLGTPDTYITSNNLMTAAAPAVTLTTPAEGASYEQGSTVTAAYTCSATDLVSCIGPVAAGSPIDTATSGPKTFTVVGTAGSANTTTVIHNYFVVDTTPPVVTLTTPALNATYEQGSAVNAVFLCSDANLVGCVGTVGNGGPIDTAAPGPKSFSVVGTDGSANVTTVTHSYTVVAPRNLPPTAEAGGPYSVAEGGSVGLGGSASDPDGDTLSYAWDLDNNGTFETLGQNAIFSAALLDGPISRTVRLQVCDDDGSCMSDAATVDVFNLAPVVNAGSDQTTAFAGTFSLSADFADGGTQDTWTYSIDWGDGSPSSTGASGGAYVIGSHQYLTLGAHTVTVCVTDDDLGKGCDALTATVVSGTGRVTAGALRFGDGGPSGFSVQSSNVGSVKGELEYHGGSINVHAHTMTAVAVSPDRTDGWFAGILTDGRTFTAYVEDNGEPGRNDVFQLWIEGLLQNGDGKLTGGNVQIHKN